MTAADCLYFRAVLSFLCPMTRSSEALNLAHRVADQLRQQLLAGNFAPGQRLSEAAMAEAQGVSRNTLREAFRLLGQEGLLQYEPHRGVSVTVPSLGDIIDIYRVRRLLECQALLQAAACHPALQKMQQAVAQAMQQREVQDWQAVGTANMAFHSAIVELTDSERLQSLFAHVLTELRLVFGLLENREFLHAPYIDLNRTILEACLQGQNAHAAQLMNDYLVRSERSVLAQYAQYIQAPAVRQRYAFR